MINIYCDGCSLNNPGEAGAGVAIFNNKEKIGEISKYLGVKTNNEAEYISVIEGLNFLLENKINKCNFFCDSKLVVEQLCGNWKIKDEKLKKLNNVAKILIGKKIINFNWVPREENEDADFLSKEGAIKKEIKKINLEKVKTNFIDNLILDKSFFGKMTCLKIQLNEEKDLYFHMGILNGKNWKWEKVKMNQNEIGEIIYGTKQKEFTTSFFHKYKTSQNQIWINKSTEKMTIKINKVSKSLVIGEIEVLRILLENCILKINF
jgi:ribonuclease HI